MLIGYVRVSTEDQSLCLQKDALRSAECNQIFEDHMSGSKAERPGLAEALKYARAGDALVVWRLDRLGALPEGFDRNGGSSLISGHWPEESS